MCVYAYIHVCCLLDNGTALLSGVILAASASGLLHTPLYTVDSGDTVCFQLSMLLVGIEGLNIQKSYKYCLSLF